MNDGDVEQGVRKYFTVEEWEQLADILKTRYTNMYRNYMTIPEAAKFLPLPQFMKERNTEKLPSDDYKRQVRGFQTKERKGKVASENNENANQRRNPKRNVPKVDYSEGQEPSDDRYIFCDNCEEVCLDFCKKCGMLKLLKDFPVPMGTEDRAKKTVPKGILEVRQSKIHGFGVFSLMPLKQGLQMGPYQGHITRVTSTDGYSWKLRNGYLIDAGDKSNSNWLRYVNCANHVDEQNIVAFQYKGNLFYRTCKRIEEGQELLVYYGPSFANNLGVDTKKYFQPREEDVELDFYVCKFCHIALSTVEYRDCHQKRCKFRGNRTISKDVELFTCQFCKCLVTSMEFLKNHEKRCSKREKHRSSNDERKLFECHYCNFNTKYKRNLNRHISANHERELSKVYHCEFCNYHTIQAGNLYSHQTAMHLGKAPYKCLSCEKGFNRKTHLDNHLLRKHDDFQHFITSKIHYCKCCSYKSTIISNLKSHMVYKHDREKAEQFQCHKCDYFALQKRTLKRHLLVHSTLRPYVCTLCKKGFNRKLLLDGHILTNHKDNAQLLLTISSKIYRCLLCKYETVRGNNMRRHNKRNHQ